MSSVQLDFNSIKIINIITLKVIYRSIINQCFHYNSLNIPNISCNLSACDLKILLVWNKIAKL